MKKKTWSDLATELPDETIPLSNLIDLAIRQVYGDIDLDPFVTCECDDTQWEFSVRMSDDDELRLTVDKKFCINFWCNEKPLHFNQAPLYAKLYQWGFLKIPAPKPKG
jgi:hypothetical protein